MLGHFKGCLRILVCVDYVKTRRKGELQSIYRDYTNIYFGKGPQFDSGPGLIRGSWTMMRHVSCISLLEWSTTSQRLWMYRISVLYAQKYPRFLFKKRRGKPQEFWSLVSTIDSSTLPQDCVENLLCGTQSNWKNIQFKKNEN